MNIDIAIEATRTSAVTALLLVLPVLSVALVIGVITGALQAATQVQDSTISSVPRMIGVVAVVLLLLPWGLSRLVEFSTGVIRDIPGSVRGTSQH